MDYTGFPPHLDTRLLMRKNDETWREWFAKHPEMYHASIFDYNGVCGEKSDVEAVNEIREDVGNRLQNLRDAISRTITPYGICLSGAARGAYTLWGQLSVSAGSQAIHWSFPGHSAKSNSQDMGLIASLSPLTTEIAAGPMTEVAKVIGRRLSYKPGVRNLLLRNWFQVFESNSLYAVSDFKNGKVEGGTAWAVEAFRLKKSGVAWVFCQTDEQWNKSVDGQEFTVGEIPDIPSGVWAGIGRRDLKASGINAIVEMGIRMKEAYGSNILQP